jgi:hypothetical protein
MIMKTTKNKSAAKYSPHPQINLGDGVVDEWQESALHPKVGTVAHIEEQDGTVFPYSVHWIDGGVLEYDENEILEMKAAYDKYKV